MQIKYYIKKAYGKEFAIILDSTTRAAISSLTKRSTLSTQDIAVLKVLGVTLKEVNPSQQ